DMIMAFPALILAIALMVALGASLINVIVAIAVTRLPYSVRVVRSVGLAAKQMAYVDAARAIGASPLRIMLSHIAPACLPSFIVVVTGSLGVAILMEASLSFLGVGIPLITPTWGGMLGGISADMFNPLPWLVYPPGIAIFVTVLAFNLLGDALRDILDPKLRGYSERA
ncbi:MAG: ABC transporter permease, partial [Chloroflexota bacterium]|nr:ABC transporter permease [Chloroflexota bacterium]